MLEHLTKAAKGSYCCGGVSDLLPRRCVVPSWRQMRRCAGEKREIGPNGFWWALPAFPTLPFSALKNTKVEPVRLLGLPVFPPLALSEQCRFVINFAKMPNHDYQHPAVSRDVLHKYVWANVVVLLLPPPPATTITSTTSTVSKTMPVRKMRRFICHMHCRASMPAHATTSMNSAPEYQSIHAAPRIRLCRNGTMHRQATAEQCKPCDPLSDSLYSLPVIPFTSILGASSIQALTKPYHATQARAEGSSHCTLADARCSWSPSKLPSVSDSGVRSLFSLPLFGAQPGNVKPSCPML